MVKTLTLYSVRIKYKDKEIVWDYGEPRGIEFHGDFVRISGVGCLCEYPYKGMTEFHMTTKEETIEFKFNTIEMKRRTSNEN